MNAPPAIYQSVADLTRRMLSAARASEWDLLANIEITRDGLLAQVKAAQQGAPQSQQSKEIAAILKDIIASNTEIRTLVEARVAELGTWLNSTSTERRLAAAYGAGTTA
ncbi:MAG: flagellar protein FliT [Burkholderiales bacterium]